MKVAEKKTETEFVTDEQGNEALIRNEEYQVMMEWERPYMEACISALEVEGADVLEVGFGCGYAADCIQKNKASSHTILECDREVLKRARAWAKGKKNVQIIEGFWQEKLDTLGSFDCIFFDDYPVDRIHQDANSSWKERLQQAKNIQAETEQKLSQQRYTDAEFNTFLSTIQQRKESLSDLAKAFIALWKRKNINSNQLESCRQALFQKGFSQEQWKQAEEKFPRKDRLINFFEQASASHMRPGTRFSCFLSEEAGEKFGEILRTYEGFSYSEEKLSIDVPKNCRYYQSNFVRVPLVKKTR